jgi:hypothetical protein
MLGLVNQSAGSNLMGLPRTFDYPDYLLFGYATDFL